MKSLYFLPLTVFLPFALLADDDVVCNATDPVDALICEDSALEAYQTALDDIWKTWQEGINATRIDYLNSEQATWLAERTECLEEDDPNACLTERYSERIQILVNPRIFQSTKNVDGNDFLLLRAMTPLTYDELEAEKSILDQPYVEMDFQKARASLTDAIEEECTLCTRERYKKFTSSYESDALLIVACEENQKHDDGDPTKNYRSFLYDKSAGASMNWLDLVQPATASFAKSALVDAIVTELEVLNRQVKGNEDGSQKYYWPETRENLSAQSDEEWALMGFQPLVEQGKITAFIYQADDFEFAPYASSSHFNNFRIEADVIIPFLKPEFASNFE